MANLVSSRPVPAPELRPVPARPRALRVPLRTRLPGLIAQGLAYAILTGWGLLALVPVYWMVVSAFKTQTENLTVPPQWIPDPVVLDNFRVLLANAYIARWFLNSLGVALAITFTQLFFNALAGYAFAKLSFPGRHLIFWAFLSMLMIPPIVTLIPLFIMVSNLKLLDTYWILIVPAMASVWGIFLMKQFMQTLPSSLFDAARIDACSEFGIFLKIAVPLARPALAVLGIFTFVGEWNSFFWWLLFTTSQAMRNLQVGLTYYRYENQVDWGPIMAGTVIAAVPVVIVFFVFQRHFQRGLTIGALKG
jgi:multiple sugar transport system permease protein